MTVRSPLTDSLEKILLLGKFKGVKVLHSTCQQIWKTQQWPQDWKRLVFIPIPKKGNAKECSNYRTFALTSQASKVMLKILVGWHHRLDRHEFAQALGVGDEQGSLACSSPWVHKESDALSD